MASYSVGDVVNVPFPNQEDRRKPTIRIAIILEDLQDEVEIVFMTSQVHQIGRYKDAFVITKNSPEGKAMRLTYDSLIAPHRKYVLKKIAITPPPRGRCLPGTIEILEDILN